MSIEPTDPHPRHRVAVAGTEIAYVDTEPGSETNLALVFLHGNPTSSYIWRNIITALEGRYRCLAPDLPGMGDSGPTPDGSYRFVDHRAAIDAWFDAVLPGEDVVLVGHDWGSALAFSWAQRHAERVAGICYMEAFVMPLHAEEFMTNEDWTAIRQGTGDDIVLDRNIFIDEYLRPNVVRELSEEEFDAYRRPFLTREARRVMINFPQEVPLDGEPADVHAAVAAYAAWLAKASVPKLLIIPTGDDQPRMLSGRALETCRKWPNQTEVNVTGRHYVQEDSPDAISAALASWLSSAVTASVAL